jgi:hypothetical protein
MRYPNKQPPRTRRRLANKPKSTYKRFFRSGRYTSGYGGRYNSGYGGLGTQRGSNGITDLVNPPRSLTPAYGGPFGQVFDTELAYADYFSLNPTTGGTLTNLFLANGLYDPAVSIGGHQPAGFNYFTDIYSNWQVLSSTIEVTLYPKMTETALINGSGFVNSANLLGCFLSIGVRDTATIMSGTLTTLTDILERPNIKTKFVNSNSEPTSIRASFSMPKFYGRTRGLDDEEITGTPVSDPNDKVYYHIIFGPPDASTDLPSMQFVVRMKFKCRFFNPKALRQA